MSVSAILSPVKDVNGYAIMGSGYNMQDHNLQSAATSLKDTVNQPGYGSKLAVGLLPFSPVKFTGPDALIAWGRLIGYSVLAYYTYNKMRPASYVLMSCAGLSLATSLSASAWGKHETASEGVAI